MTSESKENHRWAAAGFAALALLSAITLWKTAEGDVAAQSTAAGEATETLATIGDRTISRAEVEAVVSGELIKIEQERHAALEKGLDTVLADRLTAMEAEERGVSVEELFRDEVTAKVPPPTAEEVDAFYEQNKARIRQPKAEIADQIEAFLTQQGQQQAVEALIEGLKEKWNARTHLEPFRVAVPSDGFPAMGPADAPVTIVEFSDFECPYCARVAPTLDRVRETYPDTVRVVFRQFPLTGIHPNAMKAATASLCAHEQDRFWAMHDAMFASQRALSVDDLKERAAGLDLDGEAFSECLDSDRYADAIQSDMEAGAALGVTATPALFINGRLISGAQPFDAIAAVIEDELSRTR